MKKAAVWILMLACLLTSSLQADDILDRYLAQGLKSNLALRQQEFQFKKSLEVLKEAKGMFFPTLALTGRYSRAGGGRMIEIPVGDMMNPLNASINQLYRFHGVDLGFPTNIPNEMVPFLREKEQETKLRFIQPVYTPSLYHHYKITSNLSLIQKSQLDVYKRQLVMEIKTAYFNYLKSARIIELLDDTRRLLDENLRISENLVKNGKATEDVVFRAEAEIAALEQQRAKAEELSITAAMYFNFLINRDLDAPIESDYESVEILPESVPFDTALKYALEKRDEFQQMRHALDVTTHQIGLAKSGSLPSVAAVFDYGIQGEEYGFGRDDDFWMFSIVLDWTLFNGGRNRSRKAQAALEQQRLKMQQKELEKQIRLQVRKEYEALNAASLGIEAALKKEESARKSFRIVSKQYEYGIVPQITYLDAQNTYTDAAINVVITHADYFIQHARLEQVAALADIGQFEREGEK